MNTKNENEQNKINDFFDIKIITNEIEGYTVPPEYELIYLVPDLYEKIDLAAERIVKLWNLQNVTTRFSFINFMLGFMVGGIFCLTILYFTL